MGIKEFLYRPLSTDLREIRLLTVHSSPSFHDDVRLCIEKHALSQSSPPIYWALSYVWGSDNNEHTEVLINSAADPTFRRLPITQSLLNAIKHIRAKGLGSNRFWIDAICINQKDELERSHQVAMMGDVYRLAVRVLVWLGPEEADSTLAMRKLQDLGREALPAPRDRDQVAYREMAVKHGNGRFSTSFTHNEAEAYLALLFREWFDRLWIRQEIGLGHKNAVVMCGLETIDWTSFYSVVYQLRYLPAAANALPAWGKEPERAKRERLIAYLHPRSEQDIITVLHNSRESRCKDSRDRIYAALNLVNGNEHDIAEIFPDYSKPAEQVYREFSRHLYTKTNSLEQLLFCTRDADQIQIPSWAPTWTATSEKLTTHFYNCNADGHLGPVNLVFPSADVLRVEGLVYDQVKEVRDANLPDHKLETLRKVVLSLAPPGVLSSPYPPTGESLLTAYSNTLVRNAGFRWQSLYSDGTNTSGSFSFATLIEQMIRAESTNDPDKVDLPLFVGSPLIGHLSGRSLVRTNNEYIGLAPSPTRTGDLVCVLPGLEAPLILRKRIDGRFTVIGPAYIHGLMDGEALLGEISPPYERVNGRSPHGSRFRNTTTGDLQWSDPRWRGVVASSQEIDESGMTYEAWEAMVPHVTGQMLKRAGKNIEILDLA